jgi:hypothetical protein
MQTALFQNWAVGLYNDIGAYTVHKVWENPNEPDETQAQFEDGTVSAKLLFTQASVAQVLYLQGAKEWDAYIYSETLISTNPLIKRSVQKLRLLQSIWPFVIQGQTRRPDGSSVRWPTMETCLATIRGESLSRWASCGEMTGGVYDRRP